MEILPITVKATKCKLSATLNNRSVYIESIYVIKCNKLTFIKQNPSKWHNNYEVQANYNDFNSGKV